jgi:hypothetical protein
MGCSNIYNCQIYSEKGIDVGAFHGNLPQILSLEELANHSDIEVWSVDILCPLESWGCGFES